MKTYIKSSKIKSNRITLVVVIFNFIRLTPNLYGRFFRKITIKTTERKNELKKSVAHLV